jgi:hypothetical protein
LDSGSQLVSTSVAVQTYADEWDGKFDVGFCFTVLALRHPERRIKPAMMHIMSCVSKTAEHEKK